MKYILLLFIILYSYAAIRYHIGKELGIEYFTFIVNKAVAWTSATCLGFSLLKFNLPFPTKKTFGISSFILGLIHITLTLVLTFGGFFPAYYSDNRISGEGFLVIVSGVLTIILMIFPLLASLFPSRHPKPWIKLGKFALFVNILHPLIIGIKNWWVPGKWPLFLPPITLLATLIYAIILLIYWKQKRVS
jgi:hypothetical protein